MAKLLELDLSPEPRTLRQFGFIALLGFSLLAWFAFEQVAIFRFGLGPARPWVSGLLLLLGLFCGAAAAVHPRANLPIYVGLSVVFYPLGLLVSYLLMAALFFLVIGPIAMLVRLFAPDPMQRGYDKAAKSYFTPVEPRDKTRYFRQF